MSVRRTLRVVGGGDGPGEVSPGARLRVAFASKDGEVVDQHLAAAPRFFVHVVTKGDSRVLEIGEFATNGAACEGGQLAEKLEWLSSCDVVYAIAVGSAARRQLLARGVLPLRVMKDTRVRCLLNVLEEQVDDGLRSWLEQGPVNRAEEPCHSSDESSQNQEI